MGILFTASADIISSELLYLSANDPVGNISIDGEASTISVYLDYELTSDLLDSSEVFCVEESDGILRESPYTLISFDVIDAILRPKYQAAANIAEAYYNDTEINKVAAQVAIWESVFDWKNGIDLAGGNFQSGHESIKVNSILNSSFAETNNWWLAVNPDLSEEGVFTSLDEGIFGQNYLVRMGIPVPEPATMLLLGTGLIGLAGFGSKRFMK